LTPRALAGPLMVTVDVRQSATAASLRKQADAALLKMREDGDYGMIKQKWFGPDS
jgi:ABC-type amino acid transport substrate-binding protein